MLFEWLLAIVKLRPEMHAACFLPCDAGQKRWQPWTARRHGNDSMHITAKIYWWETCLQLGDRVGLLGLHASLLGKLDFLSSQGFSSLKVPLLAKDCNHVLQS